MTRFLAGMLTGALLSWGAMSLGPAMEQFAQTGREEPTARGEASAASTPSSSSNGRSVMLTVLHRRL